MFNFWASGLCRLSADKTGMHPNRGCFTCSDWQFGNLIVVLSPIAVDLPIAVYLQGFKLSIFRAQYRFNTRLKT